MKCSPFLTGCAILRSADSLTAQESAANPVPQPEPVDFVVKSTTVRPIQVVQSSEIPGWPAIHATVHLVEDAGLPDPPPRRPPADPNDPAVQAQVEAFRGKRGEEGEITLRGMVSMSTHFRPLHLEWEFMKEVAKFHKIDLQ